MPDYAVVRKEDFPPATTSPSGDFVPREQDDASDEKIDRDLPLPKLALASTQQTRDLKATAYPGTAYPSTYQELTAAAEEKFHAKLRQKRGPLGWAMRTLHNKPMGPGAIYEVSNMKLFAKRLPAMMTVGALYGLHYDIHAAQAGIHGTPEGARMERVYSYAHKYPNEVEHTYSFVQVLTACTASFAHGANDIGNSVGPWAVIYSAWNTGNAAAAKAPVPIWQLAVLSGVISVGLVTYGYNIMKGELR